MEKCNPSRAQSGGSAIHCQDCSISQLCIPYSLNETELDRLDNIIERKKPIQKGQEIFKAGEEMKSLYAIRSGTLKSYTITEQGDEQITAFHLAGDLVGFDSISSGVQSSRLGNYVASWLETKFYWLTILIFKLLPSF